MAKIDPSFVRVEWSPGEFTTYFVLQGNPFDVDQIPLAMEYDVFVVNLEAELLSNELAAEIANKIVKLPVEWVETIGPRCEYLHDVIDEASVSIGRQKRVGDGSPMTAWHELTDLDEKISYIRTGGHGAC